MGKAYVTTLSFFLHKIYFIGSTPDTDGENEQTCQGYLDTIFGFLQSDAKTFWTICVRRRNKKIYYRLHMTYKSWESTHAAGSFSAILAVHNEDI